MVPISMADMKKKNGGIVVCDVQCYNLCHARPPDEYDSLHRSI